MSEIHTSQIGHGLARLREAAGLTQADLSRRVTIGASTLSRIEGGERPTTADELGAILRGIGTPEAARFAELIERRWAVLTRPALDHRDNDLLWNAELVATRLRDLAEHGDTRHAFAKQLTEYLREVERCAHLVDDRAYRIAFVGSIGVGKSTAICRATGLETLTDSGDRQPVLEAGAGGITLCEVRLRPGPPGAFGIVVEPRTDAEVRDDVADFAEQQLRLAWSGSEAAGNSETSTSVSKELDRAIRNMSGLTKRRPPRLPSGERVPASDPARELALKIPESREYVAEVLALMDLHRRDRREVWWDPSTGDDELEWLRKTFRMINNGRHPEFSLPARIDLILPSVLECDDLELTIVDTRGVDQPTGRADLEGHLADPHTISVLCSAFNSAPEMSVNTLLSRAVETGNELVRTNAAVVVLPKHTEAMAVKHDDGFEVETAEEGYELKAEQVRNALAPLDLSDLTVEFFNAYADDVPAFRDFLIGRVELSRASFRRNLQDVVERAERLLERAQIEEVLAEQREAGRALRAWLDSHGSVPEVTELSSKTLVDEIQTVHAASVYASARRMGRWYALDYSHQLGFGARRLAFGSLKPVVARFQDVCAYEAERHEHASELMTQASTLMAQAFDEMLRKMHYVGSTIYGDQLQSAPSLWHDAIALWGTGGGYRHGVARQLRVWFNDEAQRTVEKELISVLNREWAAVRDRVGAILEVDPA